MKRILITGGAGFIGSHCVDVFLSAGYEVGVFDIRKRAQAHNIEHALQDITYIEGDVRDVRQLDSVLPMYDYVLHLAAIVSVQESFLHPLDTHHTNVTGMLNVYESAFRNGVTRVVYASSAAVYGDTDVVPTPETVPTAPLSPYGLHKVLNESYGALYAQQFGLQNIGLRFFNVYGSRQDASSPYSGVISIFAQRLEEGVSPVVYGDGSATRDFIHVYDVALACKSAVETPTTESFVANIGTGIAVSINTLLRSLAEVVAQPQAAVHEPAREGDIVHSCSDSAYAQSELQWKPKVTFTDGLTETVGRST